MEWIFMFSGNRVTRYSGRISNWNDERGFGFVVQNDDVARVFVHIKSFESLPKRPSEGDLISYALQKDHLGRISAISTRYMDASKPRRPTAGKLSVRIASVSIFLAFMLGGYLSNLVPAIVLLDFSVMSVLTFLAYGMDKYKAVNDLWRTRESTLHLMSLLGGWPGALIAQSMFRHKSSKHEFLTVFSGMVVLNCAVLAWLLISGAGDRLDQVLLHEHWIQNLFAIVEAR
jgi:uncharacterized membrane protein YsdA (DUF1294 family)/cold shock CspA family protein